MSNFIEMDSYECDFNEFSIKNEPNSDEDEESIVDSTASESTSSVFELDASSESESENSSEDENNQKQNCTNPETWSTTITPIKNFPFCETECGPIKNINSKTTPMEIFKMLFDDDIMHCFISGSNHYGHTLWDEHPQTNFQDISSEEMLKFFGLCLLNGPNRDISVRTLFSRDSILYRPIFGYVMSGRRFQMILRCFNICSMELETNCDRNCEKIEPVFNMLLENFQKVYKPYRELSLDESFTLLKGNLSFRPCVEKEFPKYDTKFYELCTSDGYVLNIDIYQGRDSDTMEPNLRILKAQQIVLKLMDPYLNKGHHLFMDEYYNSVQLSTLLLKNKTHTTGILKKNRKDNPKELISLKIKKGELLWRSKNEIYVTKWKDYEEVLSITTAYHPVLIKSNKKREEKKFKPIDIVNFLDHMNGIRRAEKIMFNYSCPREAREWYKKVFFYLLDITVWNSYFIYKKFHPKISFDNFRELITFSMLNLPEHIRHGTDLVNEVSNRGRPSKRLSSKDQEISSTTQLTHSMEKIPFPTNYKGPRKHSYFKRCRECTKTGKRKETSYQCKTCIDNPALCPTCFADYNHRN